MIMQLLSTNYGRIQRSVWCIPRGRQMFSDAMSGKLEVNWWKQNLRMSQDTFNILCNELCPFIQKKWTNMRSPVSVEERVAVTVWKLATNVE